MSTPPPPPQDPTGGQGGPQYGAPGAGGGYGAPQPANNTPQVLGIIGIVCWFFCSPASIVLGLIGASKARDSGQSDTLPKVAWIGGIVAIAIGIITNIIVATTGGYGG